jgi:hypothetical protein
MLPGKFTERASASLVGSQLFDRGFTIDADLLAGKPATLDFSDRTQDKYTSKSKKL